MLRIVHKGEFRPHMNVSFRNDELRTRHFIVTAIQYSGGLWDEYSLTATEKSFAWAAVRINLKGRVRIEQPGQVVEKDTGALFLGQGFPSVRLRTAPDEWSGVDVLTLAVRTQVPGAFGEHATIDVASAAVLRTANELAAAMRAEKPNQVLAAHLIEFLRALRSDGIADFPEDEFVAAMAEPIPNVDKLLAAAYQDSVFPLTRHPGLVDIAQRIGLGERQTNRRMHEYFQKYHVVDHGWQGYISGTRLMMASVLASAPEASTELVAKLAGFRSPTSLCHAFAEVGWASPSQVGKALRQGDGLRAVTKPPSVR